VEVVTSRRNVRGVVRYGLLMTTTALMTVGGAFFAQAQDAKLADGTVQAALLSFNISPQSLTDALAQFGLQSGMQVSANADLLRGKSSPGVSGAMKPEDALAQILKGTNIAYSLSDGKTALLYVAGSAEDGAVQLEPIHVLATNSSGHGVGFNGAPDDVYTASKSISVISREAVQKAAVRDTRQLFNTVAGVYSGDGQGSFPTVSPNIRGLQDSGRVIVSIDGARQNAQDGGRYGAAGIGSFGMAMVDTAFIRSVEVDRSVDATSNMVGSLGGGVEFRTVEADDIISDGNTWGFEVSGTGGTNAYNLDAFALGAMHIDEHFSLTVGGSRQKFGAYEAGQNGPPVSGRSDLVDRDNTGQFVKVEMAYDDFDASLAWVRQEKNFAYYVNIIDEIGSSFDTTNNTLVGDVHWNPDNPLIDLKSKVWFNRFDSLEDRDERPLFTVQTDIDKSLSSIGFSVENTSMWDIGAGALRFNYGLEGYRDEGKKSASSSVIDTDPRIASSYGAFSPAGRRDNASSFLNATYEPVEWVSVTGGLRYDWYRLKGSPTFYNFYTDVTTVTAQHVLTQYDANVQLMGQPAVDAILGAIPPLEFIWKNTWGEILNGRFVQEGNTDSTLTPVENEHTLHIDRSEGAWLPSATISFQPFDWLEPYVSYSKSLRPPTLTEAFMSGNFTPFDGVGENSAPNVNLRPERAETFEAGLNILKDDLFLKDDHLRLKLSAFRRVIDDYIVMGQIITAQEPDRPYTAFVNLADASVMRGLEFEGSYDAGTFWFGASAAKLKTDWAQKTDTYDNGTVSTNGDVFAWNSTVPPDFTGTLEAGVRLMDRRLSLGGAVHYAEPTELPIIDNNGQLRENSDAYTTYGLNASFKLDEHATFHFNADNLTDQRYIPATGSYLAPGRTLTATMSLKF
jgi:hemoglobin/transferrin/lactoferrin receptor protein